MKLYIKVEEPADVPVLLPYAKPTHQLQAVIDCLRIQNVQPELAKVDDGDAYWRLLRDRWNTGRGFFIVEQDVAVWQGAIRILNECEAPWCSLSTMCHGRMIPTTFGCVKFGTDLVEQNPGFFDDLDRTWFHLDANFADKMGWPFIRPHNHFPPATHLNEAQWPDSISTRFMLGRKISWQAMEAGGDPVVRVGTRRNGEEHVAYATVDKHG